MKKQMYLKTERFYRKHTQSSVAIFNKSHNKRHIKSKFNNTLSDLPDELLLRILSLLDVDSVLCMTFVSWKWKKLSEDNILWQDIVKRYFDVGVNSVYSKMMRLSLSNEGDGNTNFCWKREFFKHCFHKVKRVLSKVKVDSYTGVEAATELLQKYKIKFHLEVTDKQNRHYVFQSSKENFRKASVFCQWDSLDGFPPFCSISKLSVYAIIPLIFGRDNCPVTGSPTQRNLVKWEAFDRTFSMSQFVDLGSDDRIFIKQSHSGFLFGIWKDSPDNLALICTCLPYHNLIRKCFFSSSEKIYEVPHKTICDDVDPRYGLHGYTCYMCLHTKGGILWEDKFSYLSSSETPENGMLIMQPERNNVSSLRCLGWKWKTELFSGSISHLAVLDVILIDSNKDVIWNASNAVYSKLTSTNDISLENSSPLRTFKYEDDCGIVSIATSSHSEGQPSISSVEICLKISKVNQWFGTRY